MRLLTSTLVATCLVAGPFLAPATLAAPCVRSMEKEAFDVAALKSELMVVAIACQAQDRYNSFMLRFRRDLQSDERAVNNYFARAAGRRAQQEHDAYKTNLANSQSQDGVRQGTLFCSQRLPMFDEVMALKDNKGLSAYAESKGLVQPIDLTECPAPKKNFRKTADK
jgi:hypothetical protein